MLNQATMDKASGALMRESGAQTACRWGWDADFCTVAQLVEHVAVNHRVISSNLIGGAIWSSEQNWYCPRPESG